jgi:hypothetical protein
MEHMAVLGMHYMKQMGHVQSNKMALDITIQ